MQSYTAHIKKTVKYYTTRNEYWTAKVPKRTKLLVVFSTKSKK